MKYELYRAITDRLKELIKGTEFEGQVLAVGGCCRDELMGQEIKDIDMAVTLPDGGIRLAEWLEASGYTAGHAVTYPTYHTAMFHLKDFPDTELEAVQTRKEKYTDRNTRNPETAFGTIVEDCMRRDLTINALYRNISTGEIIDITGTGVDDIKNHIIRTPADPDLTYDDDPLRILRCIRFASRYGWDVDPVTWDGMVRNVDRLAIISRERIRDEFEKMLTCKYPVMAMEMLRKSGAMRFVVPDLTKTYDMEQNEYHFGTVWQHSLKVLEVLAGQTNRLPLRMAALLHDMGKVRTQGFGKDGRVHFIGHELASSEMLVAALRNLRWDNDFIQEVRFLTLYHMATKPWGPRCEQMKDKQLRKLQFICYTEDRFRDLMILIDADNKAHSPEHCMPDQVPLILQRTEEMKADGTALFGYKLPLSGEDIMRIKGLTPGPAVKDCIGYLMKLAYVDPTMDADTMTKHLNGYQLN